MAVAPAGIEGKFMTFRKDSYGIVAYVRVSSFLTCYLLQLLACFLR